MGEFFQFFENLMEENDARCRIDEDTVQRLGKHFNIINSSEQG